MHHHLQRLLVVSVLISAVAVGWWAIDREPPADSRPELVEVAAAPVVAPAVAPSAPLAPAGPSVPESVAPPAAAPAVERALPFELPESTSFPAVERAPVPEPAVVEVANTAPVADRDDEQEEARVEVQEHSISHIPDPPDVGNSDRRETFEVAPESQSDDPWLGVRRCESHNNYSINTGNGFYGAYQFTISTWDWVAEMLGRTDLVGVRPDLASPSDQDRLAQALAFEVDGGGLQHWPVCGRYYG